MKTHLITFKLSEDEYKKLKHNVELENTTVSQYIRECINGIGPSNGKDLQMIATKLCEIYVELSKKNLDKCNDIMKEMDKICRILY